MPRATSPRGSLALTLRALWWRRTSSLTLLAVATVTMAAAALGPMYARAAAESGLQDTLRSAAPADTALAYSTQTDVSQDSAVDDVRKTAPAPGSIVGYGAPTAAIQARGAATVVPGGPVDTQVVWRDGVCGHVVLVAGRCPTSATEAMVSDRSRENGTGIRLGGRLELGPVTVDHLDASGQNVGAPADVTVVGLYRPRSLADPYWAGHGYFDAHLYNGPGDGPDTVDAVFVTRQLWTSATHPTTAELDLDYALRPADVHLANEELLRRQVAAEHGITTEVTKVLDRADADRTIVLASTLLVTVQLALLAWLVLFDVMRDAAEAHGADIALAKLRGLPPRATLAFGLGEPLALVALAVPLGLVVAWLVVLAMVRAVLADGIPVVLTGGALLGVAVGFTGGVVAATLAARRVLTRPVLDQWRRVPEQHSPGAASLVLDLVLVVAALAGLAALHRAQPGQSPGAVALLAPGLLVLVVALLGVRVLPLIGRASLAPTRASPRVGAFLAVRQVLRRPAGLRLAALLAVAVGLAVFAVDAESVAKANRANRAALEVGAPTVVSVQLQPGHDPVTAVRKADPDGRWAMAAATWLPYGGPLAGSMVAVDTSRLAAVASWPRGAPLSAADAQALVHPTVAPSITVTGDQLRVTVDGVRRTAGPWPNLVARLVPTNGKTTDVRIGFLKQGTHAYAGAVPCPNGCRLAALVVDRPAGYLGTLSGTLVVSRIEAGAAGSWTPLDATFDRADDWRPAGPSETSHDRLTAGAGGLRDDYSSEGGASPAIGRADSPSPLPVLTTPASLNQSFAASGPGQDFVDALDNHATFDNVASLPLLPRVLDDGVLVDLDSVRSQLVDFDNEASWSVWLSASAPADAVARLRAAGLVTDVSVTAGERAAALGRQGPALALLLLEVCAVAGALLAAGATALAVATTGRRRSYELAALHAVGVSNRPLRRSCVGEQLLLLGTGLVLGVPAGLAAAAVALPTVREYSDSTPVPLSYVTNVPTVAGFVAALTALLVATAVVGGIALVRSAVPARLREAAP